MRASKKIKTGIVLVLVLAVVACRIGAGAGVWLSGERSEPKHCVLGAEHVEGPMAGATGRMR